MSVYHVALAGRVQRYSPIYYPDSHANSAIVPTGLRLTERPPCHTVAVRVVVYTYTRVYSIYTYAHDARIPLINTHTHTRTHTHTQRHIHDYAMHRYISSSRWIQQSLRIVVLHGRDFRGHCILVTRYYTIGRDRRRLRCIARIAPSRV